MKKLAVLIVALVTVSRSDVVSATDQHQDDPLRKVANNIISTIAPLGNATADLVYREELNRRAQGNNGVPVIMQAGLGGNVNQLIPVNTMITEAVTRLSMAYGAEASIIGANLTPGDKSLADAYLQGLSSNNSNENLYSKD